MQAHIEQLGEVQQAVARYLAGKVPYDLHQEVRQADGQTQWVCDYTIKQWSLQTFTVAAWNVTNKHRLRFKFGDTMLVVLREYNVEKIQRPEGYVPTTTTTSDIYPWFLEETTNLIYADPAFFEQVDEVIRKALFLSATSSPEHQQDDPIDYWHCATLNEVHH